MFHPIARGSRSRSKQARDIEQLYLDSTKPAVRICSMFANTYKTRQSEDVIVQKATVRTNYMSNNSRNAQAMKKARFASEIN